MLRTCHTTTRPLTRATVLKLPGCSRSAKSCIFLQISPDILRSWPPLRRPLQFEPIERLCLHSCKSWGNIPRYKWTVNRPEYVRPEGIQNGEIGFCGSHFRIVKICQFLFRTQCSITDMYTHVIFLWNKLVTKLLNAVYWKKILQLIDTSKGRNVHNFATLGPVGKTCGIGP